MSESDFYKQNTLPSIPPDRNRSQEPIPERIGPYKIESLLDKGGMSIIYLGTHPNTHDPIIIKVLSPQYLSHHDVIERFLKEAEIIALADHPNIVKLYGQGEWEGGLYIAMEFIEGISLRQYLLRNVLSLKHALEIILEISLALCHLHTHGVIHRDLKPENILVTDEGKIIVIDFGIAQVLTEKSDANLLKRSQLVGTPIYMSPEQRQNPLSVSYPSDIYSLGIISYELILGKLSHGQIHLDLVPKGLRKILGKALQTKVEDRYQDIVDYMTDISNYLHSPTFQKDNTEQEQIEIVADHLRLARYNLYPHSAPIWPKMEIGLAMHKGMPISGFFYDFMELSSGTYGILLGESSAKGPGGFIYASVLRGMIKVLSKTTDHPQEFARRLNELLVKDQMRQTFTLAYLILSLNDNEIRYISCGYGDLWKFEAENEIPTKIVANYPPVGSDYKTSYEEFCCPWNTSDILIFDPSHSLNRAMGEGTLLTDEQIKQNLLEAIQMAPQKQADTIMRKIKITFAKIFEYHSFAVISILKN